MILRRYQSADCESLAKLFYETVHQVNKRITRKNSSAPGPPAAWIYLHGIVLFRLHRSLIAIEGDHIVGFGDMDKTGYLDRLYVHKDHQGKGIASAICDALEKNAESEKIITHASITARPFFEHRGYRVVKEQQVYRQGIALINYIMEKDVPPSHEK